MALIGSLNSGISALRNFARGLEVISNNIANVNSTAYKSSRTLYTDSFSQFLKQSATSPTDGEGSNTPASQIGLGVQISSVQTSFLQGSLSTTGLSTDLAISGNGFFQVRNAQNNQLYATRAGDFRTDDRGYLTTTDGYRVQGLTGGYASYQAVVLPDGSLSYDMTVSDPTSVGDILIDFDPSYDNGRLVNSPYLVDENGDAILDSNGNTISAIGSFSSATFDADEFTSATFTAVTFTTNDSGQLQDADGNVVNSTSGTPVVAAAGTYLVNSSGQIMVDTSGAPYALDAGNYLTDSSGGFLLSSSGSPIAGAAGSYLVDSSGTIMLSTSGAPIAGEAGEYLTTSSSGTTPLLSSDGEAYAASGGDYIVDENGVPMTDDSGDPIAAYTDAEVLEQVPKMQSFSFLSNGDLNVFLTNGDSFIGGRVMLMNFNDPTALVREGTSLYTGFDAAGVIGSTTMSASDNTAGTGGLGSIEGGALELSNVDLTEEFANMITTQRSFQAGSRIITVSDDILQEVVNLKG